MARIAALAALTDAARHGASEEAADGVDSRREGRAGPAESRWRRERSAHCAGGARRCAFCDGCPRGPEAGAAPPEKTNCGRRMLDVTICGGKPAPAGCCPTNAVTRCACLSDTRALRTTTPRLRNPLNFLNLWRTRPKTCLGCIVVRSTTVPGVFGDIAMGIEQTEQSR